MMVMVMTLSGDAMDILLAGMFAGVALLVWRTTKQSARFSLILSPQRVPYEVGS